MINYNKNKLINDTLTKYYETFECTLDTADYVPEKYNNKICKYIFKNLKKTFAKIDREDKKFQSEFRKKCKIKEKSLKKKDKLSKKTNKLRIFLKNLFKRKNKNLLKGGN